VEVFKRTALIVCTALITACATGLSQEDQQKAEYFHDTGISLYRDGRFPESIRAFEEALKVSPKRADYMLSLSLAFLKSERLEEAFLWTNKACQQASMPTECAIQQATLFVASKRYTEALPWADKAIADATYPSPAEPLQLRGRALHGLGRLEEAQQAFDVATRRASSDCYSRLLLSRTLLARGHFSDSVREASIGRSLCNTNERAHEWEAFALYKSGRIAESKKKYQRIMTLFRKSEIVERNRQALTNLVNEEPLEEPTL
jgi:tetratricopeptide (TPR) repeat protein